ncbi:MAG: hypothetical protein JSV65_11130 [Armatimonadota bacterium]|nr:MAG: hypothetical protein JSV65_11130 [Armatimonadota bacterium]
MALTIWSAVGAILAALSLTPRTDTLSRLSVLWGISGLPALAALVLGAVGLDNLERTEAPLWRRVVAIVAVLGSTSVALAVVLVTASYAPRVVDEYTHGGNRSTCLSNLHALSLAARMYAQDNSGRLPPADAWSDAIWGQGYITNRKALICPAAPELRSGYAFNRALGGLQASEIADPEQTVLLFDSDLGWNGTGGLEALCSPPRHGGVNIVAAVGGDASAVTPDDERHLIWQPRPAKPADGAITPTARHSAPVPPPTPR